MFCIVYQNVANLFLTLAWFARTGFQFWSPLAVVWWSERVRLPQYLLFGWIGDVSWSHLRQKRVISRSTWIWQAWWTPLENLFVVPHVVSTNDGTCDCYNMKRRRNGRIDKSSQRISFRMDQTFLVSIRDKHKRKKRLKDIRNLPCSPNVDMKSQRKKVEMSWNGLIDWICLL